MIRAGINFRIYKDYTSYVTFDGDDCSYEKAIEVLKQEVSELVKKNKLTFIYKGKKMPIDTDIEEYQCGNIFSPKNCIGPCWDDVTIYCDIDTSKFDSDKLRVGECPDSYVPERVIWS